MRNTGLEEAHAGIKIAGRNINNLRYADDTTLMAIGEEDLKSLLMKVKEESKNSWFKGQDRKTNPESRQTAMVQPHQDWHISRWAEGPLHRRPFGR